MALSGLVWLDVSNVDTLSGSWSFLKGNSAIGVHSADLKWSSNLLGELALVHASVDK